MSLGTGVNVVHIIELSLGTGVSIREINFFLELASALK